MALIDTRRDQMFPTLSDLQIETARRFASGEPRRFAPHETVYDVGARDVPAWLILEGTITAVRRDGIGNTAPIVTHGPGQMTGETAQLSGRASLAAGIAGDDGAG